VAKYYQDRWELLDGIVADERVADMPTFETDTKMSDQESRARVAAQVLSFAEALTP
jgi:hypothetical protein